jgi:hypothetical protein
MGEKRLLTVDVPRHGLKTRVTGQAVQGRLDLYTKAGKL